MALPSATSTAPGGVARRRTGPVGLAGLAVAVVAIDLVKPVLDRAGRRTAEAFDRWDLVLPRAGSRLWGWTHYGIFVPGLPEPLRYLNTMTLIALTTVRIGLRCLSCGTTAPLVTRTWYRGMKPRSRNRRIMWAWT